MNGIPSKIIKIWMVDYCFINSQEWSTNQWTKTVSFCYLSFWNADQYISATPKWWIQAVPSSGNGQGELEEQLQNTQGLATFCVKGATYVSSLTAVLKWMPFQNLGIKRLTFRTSSKSASTLTIHWLSAHPILSSSCRELSASGPNTSCNVVASLSHFTYHIYMIYMYHCLWILVLVQQLSISVILEVDLQNSRNICKPVRSCQIRSCWSC